MFMNTVDSVAVAASPENAWSSLGIRNSGSVIFGWSPRHLTSSHPYVTVSTSEPVQSGQQLARRKRLRAAIHLVLPQKEPTTWPINVRAVGDSYNVEALQRQALPLV
jgi:hypothetical protein